MAKNEKDFNCFGSSDITCLYPGWMWKWRCKKIREGTYDSMPDFESKFQRKSVMVNDSVEITYSSMEEAEWKYLRYFCDETDKCDAYNVFRKIVMSDSSSMCYPFDSIQYYANVRVVDSDDGRVRYYSWEFPALCYDLNYLVEYKWKDSILFENSEYVVAEEGECVHRMPTIQKINTFISDATTYYLVYHSYYEWGPPYEESVCSYVLDEKGLQPVTLFMDADGLKDHAFSEYYLPDRYYKTNGEGDEWLNYFDDSTLTVYLPNESNVCDRYFAYKWNGRYFVFADSCASNPQLNMELSGYHALDMLLESERNKIRIDFMPDSSYRYAAKVVMGIIIQLLVCCQNDPIRNAS